MTTLLAPAVMTASENDRSRVLATLTAAFATDPAVRWMYPEDGQFRRHFAGFAEALGGRAFTAHTVHFTVGFTGAALWLPPGTGPDEEALIGHIERTASATLRPQLFAVVEEMGSYHPQEPHWYLPLIGVAPSQQGRGVGSALLRHALEIADCDRLPAYLESSNPRNLPLYERHGFALLGTIQHGSSPPVFPMLRHPR
jgi:ribosomal protein S18 acetylase RimI-like enzyme